MEAILEFVTTQCLNPIPDADQELDAWRLQRALGCNINVARAMVLYAADQADLDDHG